jgi:phage terminase large subunit-like protein
MPKASISKTRAKILGARASRNIQIVKADPAVRPEIALAREDFPSFCALLGKPNAEHMRPWVDAFVTGESNDDLLDIAGPPTAVLAPRGPLPLSAEILTRGGPRPLGEIAPGEKVFDMNGELTEVTAVIHFPSERIHQVAHDDGSVLLASANHDLLVKQEGAPRGAWQRMPLKELARELRQPGAPAWMAPRPGPLRFYPQDLPIAPYLLGTLLGKSSMSGTSLRVTAAGHAIARIEGEEMLPGAVQFSPIVSSVDARSVVPREPGGYHPLKAKLQAAGLWGKSAFERFIPPAYLKGSVAQRLQLLQGYCDQRGSVLVQGPRRRLWATCRLQATGAQLLDDLKVLVESLGGWVRPLQEARVRSFEFLLPPDMMPFSDPELVAKFWRFTDPAEVERRLLRRITGITRLHSERTGCLSVESTTRTFLTADLVVSCNSAKSTVLGMLLAWVIGRHATAGKLLRILYCSYSLPVARGKSAAIKGIIRSSLYKEIFPAVRLSKELTSPELWCIDLDHAQIDAVGEDAFTVAATGVLGAIASKRANLVVPDDLIKSRNSIKRLEVRQEMVRNWDEVIEPTMFEGSRVFSPGTRFLKTDIYGTRFNEEYGWRVLRQQAILYDDDGTPRSYWPERAALPWLLAKQKRNPIAFAYQYQNEAVEQTESGVSEALIKYGEIPDDYDELVVGIDLSSSKSERSDWTVMTLAGIADGTIYVIDHRRVRSIGNIEKIHELCDLLWEWNILGKSGEEYYPTASEVTILPEEVAYQNSFRGDFEALVIEQWGLHNLVVRGQKAKGDKLTHLRSVVGVLERNGLIFNRFRHWQTYVSEIVNHGSVDHDDCVDSLELCVRRLDRRGGRIEVQ